ncbi:Pal1 cell morphology [Penicillium concentricum]|uniref:Pal1 cell morphology n=1 Tax=Penicillium concentricum TaxID=293559 RepID=A0A9W9S4J6_9EURO|nr:Pal1 cell morphology [Penicillium concentricum]KAJ5371943.1 Pal1 cell morphology [Penicillium concentricum]
MAVNCIPMASSHYPHFNQHSQDRQNVGTMGNNNPYARYISPAPSAYSRRSRSESLNSAPSIWYSGTPEHHPVEPRRKREHSAPHRRHNKYPRHSQLVQPDIIDRLDNVTNFSYHHEGPYDAARPERNRYVQSSPLEAVKESNAEALRATPHHKIADAVNSHRPLDGVAFYPPGTTDRNGQEYSYEEGSNMMNDFAGNFMRMPGMKFTDEDFKNDPFYNRPLVNPFSELRKKISLKLKKRRNTN